MRYRTIESCGAVVGYLYNDGHMKALLHSLMGLPYCMGSDRSATYFALHDGKGKYRLLRPVWKPHS